MHSYHTVGVYIHTNNVFRVFLGLTYYKSECKHSCTCDAGVPERSRAAIADDSTSGLPN